MNADEQTDTPAKPTVTAVEGSATSLTATWVKPGLNGGPDITSYDVEYREGTAGTWTFTLRTTGEVTATIDGLTANTEHQVRVRALNGETPSDWSDPSEAVRTNSTNNNAPVFSGTTPTREVPENSAAGTNVGAAFPAATGRRRRHADLLHGRHGRGLLHLRHNGPADPDQDGSDLQPRGEVVLRGDGEGVGRHRQRHRRRDHQPHVTWPSSRTNRRSRRWRRSRARRRELVASWTEPGLNGGPAIIGYEVEYREGMSGAWTFGVRTTEVTWRITGLRGNTSYQVQVRALNGETPSAWSDPSDAVRTNAEADAPTVESVAVKSAPQSGDDTYGWGETIVFTL